MGIFLATVKEWVGWVAVLVAAYLMIILIRQSLKRTRDWRSVLIVAALVLLPALLLAFLYYDGNVLDVFNTDLDKLKADSWWIFEIERSNGEGEDAEKIVVTVNIIAALIIIALLYIVMTILISVASTAYYNRKKTEWLAIHKALIKWPVVIVGCCICLKIQIGAILVGTSVIVIGLGLVLKEMLENLFTGMALEMEGTVNQGDWIQVGDSDQVGRVFEKSWRVTKIQTLNDESITIPNRLLGTEKILNFNKPDGPHARNLYVGTSYNDPPVKVKEILRTILIREPEVLDKPQPLVRTIEYGDFAINFEMKFWIRSYARRNFIEDKIMTQIWYAFKFYGVQIPFPIRTLHMKKMEHLEEESTAIVDETKEKLYFLRDLPYFECLVQKDLEYMALNSFRRNYDVGERVVHKNEIGDALYVVMKGYCEAILPDGRRPRIEAGQYFGEMGLLGATPRTVDVAAGEEGTLVMRIDKHCMTMLFRTYPELLDHFREIRDARKRDLPSDETQITARREGLVRKFCLGMKDFFKPW